MIEKALRIKNTRLTRTLICLLILIVLFSFTLVPVSAAEDTSYRLEAEKLKSLGLFKGTDIGFELDRIPNRAEAGVMLVRLLGMESEALVNDLPHPFDDVPDWADRFVGFMWENGLTKGVGENHFAPYDPVDARSYLTFILRALGYSDSEGDFTWERALEFSYQIGLINGREFEDLKVFSFTRGNMAALSYNAMNFRLKDNNITLAAHLVNTGAIDKDIATSENFLFNFPDWEKYLRYLESGYFKPYVVGKDLDTALIELRKSGATDIEIVYSYNELVREGNIISQDYPAYIESGDSYACSLEVSLGPTILYQTQLQEIIDSKGWTEDIAPYIIAAAKFLIRETALTRYDVFIRLEKNINDIIIVDEEASAKMYFGAVYEANTGNLYINRFIMDEELILHEITHAMSYSPDTGKVGFPETGYNTRDITEAFTHYTAGRIRGESTGRLNVFNTGTEDIVFSGGEYSGDGDNNFVLGVYSPLFTLTGRQQIEKMFFMDINSYSREVLDFNTKYGEQRWETLWSLADRFIASSSFLSYEERTVMAEAYSSYLDGIIDCLYIDLTQASDSENKLLILRNKVDIIKTQFPLNYRDYRLKLMELENEIALQLSEFREVGIFEATGKWIVPKITGVDALKVYNILTILGDAGDIGYEIVDSELSEGVASGVIYRDEESSDSEGVLIQEGDRLDLGGVYIIQIPGFLNGFKNYVAMRDIVTDFGRYLADFTRLDSFIVGKLLESEGFRYKYEFLYFDDVSPQMNGRIVGQFPEPGSAIIPGETTIIIRIVRKRP